eukprot:COSAG02_NODE_19422_length_882_cov_1.882503_2_plen_36_part_01
MALATTLTPLTGLDGGQSDQDVLPSIQLFDSTDKSL